MSNGRGAAARFAERRRLEDEAPRLREIAPTLVGLRMDFREGRDDATSADVSHTRRVMVAVAPALFLLPCGNAACRDGGHDLTHDIVRGLRDKKTEILGQDTCYGQTGTAECGRILRFTAHAEYEATP